MDLRVLKKQVDGLPKASSIIREFENRWIKPIRVSSNTELPFLQNVTNKSHINMQLKHLKKELAALHTGDLLGVRLRQQVRWLIDSKLHQLRGYHKQAQAVAHRLATDEVYNVTHTNEEIIHFHAQVRQAADLHEHIVSQIAPNLEQQVLLLSLPHSHSMRKLVQLSRLQKQLIYSIVKITQSDGHTLVA